MTQRVHLDGQTPHDLSIHGSFTKGIYRDAYPTIDPTRPALSQAGKVVMITGASKGIGRDVSGIALEFNDFPLNGHHGLTLVPRGTRLSLQSSPKLEPGQLL